MSRTKLVSLLSNVGLLVVLTTLVAAGCTAADTARGSLVGRVTRPIAHASTGAVSEVPYPSQWVTVSKAGQIVAKVKTDEAGAFHFRLQRGEYIAEVQCSSIAVKVAIDSNVVSRRDFRCTGL